MNVEDRAAVLSLSCLLKLGSTLSLVLLKHRILVGTPLQGLHTTICKLPHLRHPQRRSTVAEVRCATYNLLD